ncbi:T9SS type A sorting domain-containing protein [Aquiflexum sp. TKW24L]|uniref:LamG-like jellyroll fold domain-containing protein n=1 Tax=Aquiflexum sp. TKW24L TaxID=2942212 RepID=UPI0020BF4D8F|nr:LamG-like jellyroll fold domain-containing protein [Aquiflexum sp. TKW24L]MCL6260784.1 T9SS type A sorting domain-containing protein [Aquiflexum sp. TKW24L]
MKILNQRLLITCFLLFFQSHLFSSSALSQTYPPSDFDPNLSQIIAFPGAEGFGKYTTGGRGGQILKVTNLNDSGPGSLREAIDTRGARIIVFEVSGNIKLKSILKIRHGNITIAGQTAPGEGITIQDYPFQVADVKNVIIRFIRSRQGDLANVEGDSFDAKNVVGLIVDHCSFTWGTDETCSIYDVHDATLQNCIIAEGLNSSVHSKGRHGFGSIMGGNGFSLIHNLWAHFVIRVPSMASGSIPSLMDLKNNVIYNWESRAANNGSKVNANFFSNYYKPGPATLSNGGYTPLIYLWPSAVNSDRSTYGKFYLESNKLVGHSIIESNQWAGVRLESTVLTNTYLESLKNKDQNGKLVPFQTPANLYDQNISADAAFLSVLNNVGANLFRDAVDQRILDDVKNGTITTKGSKTGLLGIIDSQKDVGGWPLLKSLSAPLDTDQDGMPDAWESANKLNPTQSNDREYNLSPYYTDIEVYINSLVSDLVKDQYPSTPLAVTPLLPSSNANNVTPIDVSFAWEPVVNADTYQIQISKSSSFSSGNITLSNLKNKSLVYPQLDANSTYFWRVRAFLSGVSGPYSVSRSFQTNSLNAVPGRTVLLQPSDNQSEVSLSPIFSWAKVPNTQSYQIQVSSLSDFSALVVNQSELPETSFISPKLAENKTYYWRVRARNANGSGSYSSVGSFKTVSYSSVPEVVVPIRPTNGVNINPVNIKLEWNPISSAESYRVQISTNNAFSSTVLDKIGILDNFLDIPNLKSNTTYYWRVVGINRTGTGWYASNFSSFRTSPFTQTPSQIVLINPVNDSNLFSTSITFSWNGDPIAQNYTFQLSTNENFTSYVANISGLTSTSRTVSNLQTNTQYYWRVWATNDAGSSPFSEVRKVRSATYSGTPPATTLVSPANNAVVGSTDILFNWQNQPNSEFYRLEISESVTFSSLVFVKSSIRETSWLVPTLTSNKTYYWRVRTSNPAGTGKYSEVWKFSSSTGTVSLSQPVLKSPDNTALNQATNLSFSWSSVSNATSYDIQISESNTFSNIAFSQSNVTTTSANFASLLEDKTYFWRVRAKTGSTNSNWSDIWNFSTQGQIGTSPLDAGLVGYWTMEEGSGTRLLDQSGKNNNLTLLNQAGTSWANGVQGKAVLLNGGSNTFASLAHNSSLQIPNGLTITAWVRPNLLHRGTIMNKSAGNGFEFWFDLDGQLEFRLNRTNNGSSYRLRSNFNYSNSLKTWIHVAATFDGSACKIFINGVEDKSITYNPFSIGTTSGNLILGALGTIQRWQGGMDEVRLYNRALSIQEINLAKENSGSIESLKFSPMALSGYWKMDEGSGNQFLDASENANHGSVSNTSGMSWSSGKLGLGVNLTGSSNQFARVPHHSSLELSKSLTIAAWVKPNVMHRGTIVSKSAGNGFELWLDLDGSIEFRLNRTNNGSTYRIKTPYNYTNDLKKWVHVAATFDGQTIKVYINGVENISRTYSSPFEIGTLSGDLVIGALGTIQRFNGSLDDLQIYGGALSATEIQAIIGQNNVFRINDQGMDKNLNRTQTQESPTLQILEEKTLSKEESKAILFPNPAQDKISVSPLWIQEGPLQVAIVDLNGRTATEKIMEVTNHTLEIEFSDLNLVSGYYILILQDTQHREIFKFIKK